MVDDATILYFLEKFIIGILIFIRITGIFISAPFFKSSSIPTQVKIMISVILATVITHAYHQETPAIDFHLWNLVPIVFKELLVGLLIGFAANFVFFAAKMAGGLIDLDMGYQTSLLFDRDAGSPSLMGGFKELIILMIFLIINGHHYLIEGIYLSVKAVPLTQFEITETTLDLLMKGSTTVFILAVKMSSPILVSLFLTNLSLALLARVAPQTNIFILSFQLKIAVGLIVLLGSVSLFVWVSKLALEPLQEDLVRFILSLWGGRV